MLKGPIYMKDGRMMFKKVLGIIIQSIQIQKINGFCISSLLYSLMNDIEKQNKKHIIN